MKRNKAVDILESSRNYINGSRTLRLSIHEADISVQYGIVLYRHRILL